MRWINPFSATPRYTFVEFETLPGELVVLHGEDFNVKLNLMDDSRLKAEHVNWHFGDLTETTEALTDGSKG